MKGPGNMRYVLIAAPFATLGTATYVIDQNVVSFLFAIVTVVGLVIAVLKYIDARIDHKLNNQTHIFMLELNLLRAELGLSQRPTHGLLKHEGET